MYASQGDSLNNAKTELKKARENNDEERIVYYTNKLRNYYIDTITKNSKVEKSRIENLSLEQLEQYASFVLRIKSSDTNVFNLFFEQFNLVIEKKDVASEYKKETEEMKKRYLQMLGERKLTTDIDKLNEIILGLISSIKIESFVEYTKRIIEEGLSEEAIKSIQERYLIIDRIKEKTSQIDIEKIYNYPVEQLKRIQEVLDTFRDENVNKIGLISRQFDAIICSLDDNSDEKKKMQDKKLAFLQKSGLRTISNDELERIFTNLITLSYETPIIHVDPNKGIEI